MVSEVKVGSLLLLMISRTHSVSFASSRLFILPSKTSQSLASNPLPSHNLVLVNALLSSFPRAMRPGRSTSALPSFIMFGRLAFVKQHHRPFTPCCLSAVVRHYPNHSLIFPVALAFATA
ncbi:hypothetical protein SISSUDRAFT_1055137 [Sistotremastrum suecicum HHB10207 ss-3]|uniref:Secreted protein n=1 Tax=Sistotremastrum suecicum HHB10207 ss-3 TaxID=1314776 RepID=A0A165Y0S6_9AGAM|nr:hypothetical protein SISSUDRAFT_1055137 [Sistotremastrum suecicum HHB10207 ss-3]